MSSKDTDHIVVKVTDQQYEEVKYMEPESPTFVVPEFASPTTVADARHTDVVKEDNTVDTVLTEMLLLWYYEKLISVKGLGYHGTSSSSSLWLIMIKELDL